MKEEGKNIEEIFRSKLESFESPVNDAMWSKISDNIGNTASSSAAGAAGKTLLGKTLTTIAIAVTTGLVATGITVMVMSDKNEEKTQNNTIVKQEIQQPEELIVLEEQVDEEQEKPVEIPTNNPTHENDPVLQSYNTSAPKETQKTSTNKEEEIINGNQSSAISSFMTPQKELEKQKESNKTQTQKNEQPEESVVNEEKEEANVNSSETETNTIKVNKPIEANILIAPVGGYAPLDVSFANQSNNSNVNVFWSFGDGTNSRKENIVHTYEEPGIYKVEIIVSDENGNTKKDSREIEVLAKSSLKNIPNIFTPNGDGENDLYIIQGENIKDFRMIIFNQNGNEIYQTSDINRGWDGKDRFGNDVSEGYYNYYVIAIGSDGNKYEYTGFVELTR